MTLNVTRIAFPGLIFTNLSLSLAAARTTCLLGTSGSGKTTLLRALAGLLPHGPHQFAITPDPPPAVSYMAQQDGLLPWATVLDNVLLAPRLATRSIAPAQKTRALALLEALGLGGLAAARPIGLSGGQRQRVALARTLFADAPLVLMDEPFAALDFPTRWRLQAVAAAHLAGRTVLLVTHDPLEALRLGHQLLVLDRGGVTSPPRLLSFIPPPGHPPRTAEVCAPHHAALVAEIAGQEGG